MTRGAWKDDVHIFTYESREILYQVSSGNFFEMDEAVHDALRWAMADHSREDVVTLLSRDYGFEDGLNIVEELEAHDILTFGAGVPSQDVAKTSGRDSRAPLDVTLHISHGCNITCTYCFAGGGSYGGKATMMDFETGKQSIDWVLDQSEAAGACQITLFGGEPLLNLDLIKQIVPYAKAQAKEREIEITFGMTTNGTLLSGEALVYIMKEDIGVMVSLDGNAETHNRIRTFHDGSDTYDVIAENTRKAAAMRPGNVKVRATMTSKNLNINEIVEDISQFGTSTVEVAPTTEHPNSPTAIRKEHVPELQKHLKSLSKTELAKLLKGENQPHAFFAGKIQQVLDPAKKDYGCGGGKTFYGISADGSIYFCSAFASNEEFKMGDVFTGLYAKKMDQFDHDFKVDNRAVCKTCWARNLCGGGCVYDAQMSTGKAVEPNPVSCEQIRYGYELAMGMALEIQESNPAVFDALCPNEIALEGVCDASDA
ncbi:MAG: SPASM domain-containing protein [Candidatus Latescibacteria bacterium]|jgi:uncharacterized protein|nr:SPASM domain-containing protein [Candidatus Latescibacterota bacterium]MBT4136793.1 SPASM domain-containing protein [Candidatus Latescibacterota bacterium]MBT5828951.1 SPASM domain-containing protein [Candidatus Latescibacterota bacterium]